MPICQTDEIRLTNSASSAFFVRSNSLILAFNLSSHLRLSGPKQRLSSGCKISVTCGGDFNKWTLSLVELRGWKYGPYIHQTTITLSDLYFLKQKHQTNLRIHQFPSNHWLLPHKKYLGKAISPRHEDQNFLPWKMINGSKTFPEALQTANAVIFFLRAP